MELSKCNLKPSKTKQQKAPESPTLADKLLDSMLTCSVWLSILQH